MQYPNVGGFFFSCVQMGLYFWYRKPRNTAVLPTTSDSMSPISATAAATQRVIELPAGTHAFTILSVSPIPILGVHKVEVVAAEQAADGVAAAAAADKELLQNKPEVIEITAAV